MNSLKPSRTKQHYQTLCDYHAETGAFYQPSLRQLQVLADYLTANERQVRYFACLAQRAAQHRLDPRCAEVSDGQFDPIKALFYLKDVDTTTALWLAFLIIHTGDGPQSHWQYVTHLYAAYREADRQAHTLGIALDAAEWVDAWLITTRNDVQRLKFGKHRKYESVRQLASVVHSFQNWLIDMGGLDGLKAVKPAGVVPVGHLRQLDIKMQRFAYLYRQMRVFRFGRLAKFEFLSLLGYVGLLPIKADHCYLTEATGPKRGAKLLFGTRHDSQLEQLAVEVADALAVDYAVFEAALCHWQASPDDYQAH